MTYYNPGVATQPAAILGIAWPGLATLLEPLGRYARYDAPLRQRGGSRLGCWGLCRLLSAPMICPIIGAIDQHHATIAMSEGCLVEGKSPVAGGMDRASGM